jgi:hypothetical protein
MKFTMYTKVPLLKNSDGHEHSRSGCGEAARGRTSQPSRARQQQSRDGNGASSTFLSSSSSSAREHVSTAAPANTGRVTNTTQPQKSQARQMVQLTLTNVDRAQKNKRNLYTMIFSDSDDERGDKEEHYEHDDEGSLYAESTGDATEGAHNDNTGNKTKKTTAATVEKPRKKRSENSRLESPWG